MIVCVLFDCGHFLDLATADEPPPRNPDDELPRITYPLIVEHMIDPGDKMTCITCDQTREVISAV